ncbi:MAG: NAD(P)/FAD-dependent oxidoreductase [Clostridia bacterium]
MFSTDILVIGSGPAGLGAAIEAARLGAKVLLVDENERAGGQLYKQIHKFFGSKEHYAGMRGFQIADMLLAEAIELGVDVRLDTRALGIMDNGEFSLLQKDTLTAVQAKKIILCTGAKENALSFPGWTLPGVMTAGAAQTFANIHGILPGKRILMVGSGNVGLIVSYQLMQAGGEIAALIDVLSKTSGYQVHAGKIQRAGVPIYLTHTVVAANGNGRVEEAIIAEVDAQFQPIVGTEKSIEVDTILLAVGLTPRIDLAGMCGCKTIFAGPLGGIMPIHDCYMLSSKENIYVCGDLAGVEEANTALEEGRLAGIHAALSLSYTNSLAANKLSDLQQSLSALRSGEHAAKRFVCKEKIMQEGDALHVRT